MQNGLVASSLRETGQQWDFPNCWPPLQHAVAKGAQASCGEGGARLAAEMAHSWRAAGPAGALPAPPWVIRWTAPRQLALARRVVYACHAAAPRAG